MEQEACPRMSRRVPESDDDGHMRRASVCSFALQSGGDLKARQGSPVQATRRPACKASEEHQLTVTSEMIVDSLGKAGWRSGIYFRTEPWRTLGGLVFPAQSCISRSRPRPASGGPAWRPVLWSMRCGHVRSS